MWEIVKTEQFSLERETLALMGVELKFLNIFTNKLDTKNSNGLINLAVYTQV